MTGRGRPFRFLVAVMAGWTGIRVAILWPQIDDPTELIRAAVPIAAAAAPVNLPAPVRTPLVSMAPVVAPPPLAVAGSVAASDGSQRALAMFNLVHFAPPETPEATFGAPAVVPPAMLAHSVAQASRWSVSAWVLARDGGGPAAAGGPLLGGGQAGARVAYALTPQLAAVGRVSAPLSGPGKEAAVGVEWRPGKLPVRLVAEQRFAIDGNGGAAPVVGVVGGVYGVPIAAGFALEGYAQGGVIARNGVSGFVDVIARVTRKFAARPIGIDAGVGAWASAQRGAARLDLGPTAGFAVPVSGKALRLTADWRERVAGDARPASGPAMTLGIDF